MSRTWRQFKRKFKTLVLTKLETGKALAKLSREHDIHLSMIIEWRKEYREELQRIHSEVAGEPIRNKPRL